MIEKISELVRQGGKMILSADHIRESVSVKPGSANFVTRYDVAVQEFLERELLSLFPQAAFIGEEKDAETHADAEYAFIVDPIDGTTNFIKGYPRCAVSVGLSRRGNMELGVVYNPFADELFCAKRGEGATLNGRRIQVSENALKDGVVCFGTSPYYPELAQTSFALAGNLYQNAMDLRRTGSAALDLCDVACGRCELFFEAVLSPWDYAAASLIVEEAGGVAVDMAGKGLRFDQKCSVLAGNQAAVSDYFALTGSGENKQLIHG
ncbi:MAG: inositol monophosphatase [Clostridiales bacterium]|nr:inositol monophosphatase [Clostridiales bacterium]